VGVLVIFRLAGVPAVPVVVVPALNFGVYARTVVDNVASASAMAVSDAMRCVFIMFKFPSVALPFSRFEPDPTSIRAGG